MAACRALKVDCPSEKEISMEKAPKTNPDENAKVKLEDRPVAHPKKPIEGKKDVKGEPNVDTNS